MKQSESSMIHATDRYAAFGVSYPNPETVCAGPCEGLGCYPQFLAGPWLRPTAATLVNDEEPTEEEIKHWHEVHLTAQHEVSQSPPYEKICDGWHFIKCPDCDGSGKHNVPTRESASSTT